MDISGSMTGKRINVLRGAVKQFIEKMVPDGRAIGLVSFSTKAYKVHDVAVVTSNTRQTLSKAVPTYVTGTTSIGSGLTKSLELIKIYSGGKAMAGSTIILITDGEENVAPMIADVIPSLISEEVRVITFAFGNQASDKLEHLAKVTSGDGHSFTLSSDEATEAGKVANTLLQSFNKFDCDIENQQVPILNDLFTFSMEKSVQTVIIDPNLGKNTIFAIGTADVNKLIVTFESQVTGEKFDSSKPGYSKDENWIFLKLAQSTVGPWTISLKNHLDMNQLHFRSLFK